MKNYLEKYLSLLILSVYLLTFSSEVNAASCWIDHADHSVEGVKLYFNNNVRLIGSVTEEANKKVPIRINNGIVSKSLVVNSGKDISIISEEKDFILVKDNYKLSLSSYQEKCELVLRVEDDIPKIYLVDHKYFSNDRLLEP